MNIHADRLRRWWMGWCPQVPLSPKNTEHVTLLPRVVPPIHRMLGGIVPLVFLLGIRLLVYSHYEPRSYDIWNSIMLYLMLLPIDGVAAQVYGLWSGKKGIAFLVGFLPSVVALSVPIMRVGGQSDFIKPLFLGLGMGAMGFEGAHYRGDRAKGRLVAGFFLWVFFLYVLIFSSG